MRVLVYKRTHEGDPDRYGRFGAHDCMGEIRDRSFDAVIGVGGIGPEARRNGIAGKINWIGVGTHKISLPRKRGPVVMFDHFRDFRVHGPDFRGLTPVLADWIYSNNIRHLLVELGDDKYREALKILRLAEAAPPSPALGTERSRIRRIRSCVNTRRNRRGTKEDSQCRDSG